MTTRAAKGWVHIIGLGDYLGTRISDLKPGMHILYSFGYTAEVVSVEPQTVKSVRLVTRYGDREYTETKRKSTLVAAIVPES